MFLRTGRDRRSVILEVWEVQEIVGLFIRSGRRTGSIVRIVRVGRYDRYCGIIECLCSLSDRFRPKNGGV